MISAGKTVSFTDTIVGVDALTDRRPLSFDWDLNFAQVPTRETFQIWRSCRDGRTMPTRADIKPSAIARFSPHVGLVDVGGGGAYRIRRAGGKLEELFGAMTGKSLHEFLPPELETRWRLVFDSVCERRLPLRVTTGIELRRMSWLRPEMFFGPLGDDAVSMLLMAFVATPRSDLGG
jgi:hypothetical protein